MIRRALRWVLLALVFTLVLVQARLALGQITFGATLTVLRGTISVVHSNGTAVQPAASGLTLNEGDRIATVGKSSALVTFFDGSEIELGADTTIAIQDASGEAGGVVTFLIEVVLGSTVHKVATLKNPGSSYQIVAGEGLVEVRGTTVGVGVNGQGAATTFLQEGQATFNGYVMHNGEGCTLAATGAFECGNQKGSNVWSVLSEGIVNGEPKQQDLSNTQKTDEKDKKEPVPSPSPSPEPEREGRPQQP
jgi:hypothetical protein